MLAANDAVRPRVTIVTPSFNYGRFIGSCLESVRAQTYPRIEHLVLDALSTDETRVVIESFRGRHAMTAFFEADRGQADALNKGFARAAGDIFAWLNADDFYLHDRVVEEAVDVLVREPEVDVVTGGGIYVDERGRRGRPIPVRGDAILRYLAFHDTILQPATFWRRSAHRQLDARLHFTFDWKLFLEMVRQGANIRPVPGEWAAYRVHGVNKTAADPARRRAEMAEIMRDVHGERSFQYRWGRFIYRAYAFSEAHRMPSIKRAAQVANELAFHASGRRVSL